MAAAALSFTEVGRHCFLFSEKKLGWFFSEVKGQLIEAPRKQLVDGEAR